MYYHTRFRNFTDFRRGRRYLFSCAGRRFRNWLLSLQFAFINLLVTALTDSTSTSTKKKLLTRCKQDKSGWRMRDAEKKLHLIIADCLSDRDKLFPLRGFWSLFTSWFPPTERLRAEKPERFAGVTEERGYFYCREKWNHDVRHFLVPLSGFETHLHLIWKSFTRGCSFKIRDFSWKREIAGSFHIKGVVWIF